LDKGEGEHQIMVLFEDLAAGDGKKDGIGWFVEVVANLL